MLLSASCREPEYSSTLCGSSTEHCCSCVWGLLALLTWGSGTDRTLSGRWALWLAWDSLASSSLAGTFTKHLCNSELQADCKVTPDMASDLCHSHWHDQFQMPFLKIHFSLTGWTQVFYKGCRLLSPLLDRIVCLENCKCALCCWASPLNPSIKLNPKDNLSSAPFPWNHDEEHAPTWCRETLNKAVVRQK